MINIAAFIDFKSGKLSPRSTQIINFVRFLQVNFTEFDQVFFYTFDQVDSVEIPSIKQASLTYIDGLTNNNVLANTQVNQIINSLSTNNCNCLIGFKSPLYDQIFSLAAVKNKLPIISQVISVANKEGKLHVKQSIFSGKANSYIGLNPSGVFLLNPAFELNQTSTFNISIQSSNMGLDSAIPYTITGQSKQVHGTSLVDAIYVVGAGRGLKDPSNWVMIEELASKIGAATACSKPVSDINWRPHSEHVGQTGIKIAPQLYIACGISGAIQHLAGVNGSKSIIVINNDPEAPFFKYADYGIVGDVFDIVPEILKNL